MEWQPIETAPKDGNFILGFGRTSRSAGSAIAMIRWEWDEYDSMEVVKTEYDPETGKIISEQKALVKKGRGYWSGEVTPTHWMPLPEPPKP